MIAQGMRQTLQIVSFFLKDRRILDKFVSQGLFIDSVVVEAACSTVIGQRLKQSGMHWTVYNANNIIALRCCIMSNRW